MVNCRFCSTGHQGFNRNLKTSEIIGQLWWAKRVLEADIGTARLESARATDDTRVISNVVMMGMGEPLLNYDRAAGPAPDARRQRLWPVAPPRHGVDLRRRADDGPPVAGLSGGAGRVAACAQRRCATSWCR